MNQVADILPDFTIREANKFINVQGEFPLIIKFDYVGKWQLKGTTRLYVVAGVELPSDYTYFHTAHTWINTKRKFYITNFMCSRIGLLPQATQWYLLEKEADGRIGVELLRYELTHCFLPYLDQLTTLKGMVSLLRRDKPNRNELLDTTPIYKRAYIYDWFAVIYLLFETQQITEAEQCINDFITLINDTHLPENYAQNSAATLNKLQAHFGLKTAYVHDVPTNTIKVVD